MSHSGNFTVVLDACVLYPASIRDLLLTLAEKGLFRPKWSPQIQDEWRRNLMQARPDIPSEVLDRTIRLMDKAFEDANVENFANIQVDINLPDPKDNHVLAAAIKAKADLIVTFNLKDFPSEYLQSYGLDVLDPDTFIENLVDLDEELAFEAVLELSTRLKNPSRPLIGILDYYKQLGLVKTAERFIRVI